jgi:hypothetical protein
MAKSLLSLALIVMQLLSWSASPLYLCLSSDGSVCVDLGPDACECCKHSAVESETCDATHESCADHNHGMPENQGTSLASFSVGDPCGCTHVQISQPQSPTLNRSSARADISHSVIFLITMHCNLVPAVASPPIGQATALSPAHHVPSMRLTVLATIVIRC